MSAVYPHSNRTASCSEEEWQTHIILRLDVRSMLQKEFHSVLFDLQIHWCHIFGFTGAGGLFRLRADGLSDRALEVREVLTDGSRVIDPAQASFEALSN